MPGRLIPLVTNEIYHVFNLGINHQPTFRSRREYRRFIDLIDFYSYAAPPLRFSRFLNLSSQRRAEFIESLRTSNPLIELFSYCLMPNHFHLLIKQSQEGGISSFISNLLNSYTRYSNTKNERLGPLFLNQFKAVRIETEEQLLHVSRYIHLNPYTSFVVKDLNRLPAYPWSSFSEFLGSDEKNICEKDLILSFFGKNSTYKDFVLDQADYQRTLGNIKHLLIE